MFERERVRILFELKSSRHFADRMSNDIRVKQDAAAKMQLSITEIKVKKTNYCGALLFDEFIFFL